MSKPAMLNKTHLKRLNFNPDDFFKSDTVYRLNNDSCKNNDIINYPEPDKEQAILPCLMVLADKLQEIRSLLGKPITINSAYRCLELNRLIGSKDNSQHIQGQAADFICPAFGSPQEIVKALMDNKITVDQCLVERSWVHLSIKHNGNRNQFGKLINGKFELLK